ncbi:hypothetical protein [Streptomyces syringium]|uniref:hypothetical protein n=1 Tax=Streptomyces syringium TaxID=76729 RepID=UPI00340AA459
MALGCRRRRRPCRFLARPTGDFDRNICRRRANPFSKARLQREHWRLVFKDPGTATRAKFEKGDFESCTTDATLDRLRHIVGLRIDDKAAADLKSLAKSRNALQHYGLTAPATVEARAASILDFLLAFVYDHLLPELTQEEVVGIAFHLDGVAETVRGLQSFLTKRRNRLKGELKGCQDRTIECPSCGEWALVVGEPSAACRFCHSQWTNWFTAAFRYLHGPLEEEYHGEVWDCPDCNGSGCDEVRVAAAPDAPQSLCFDCGTGFVDLVSCTSCSRSTSPSDTGICEGCLAVRFAKF